MIKLSVTEPQVSYLTYPDFDRDPHPTLRSAITVNLRKLSRLARLQPLGEPAAAAPQGGVPRDGRTRGGRLYERLTRAEMRAGLYEHPERIGTLKGWQATLAAGGLCGHSFGVCRPVRTFRAESIPREREAPRVPSPVRAALAADQRSAQSPRLSPGHAAEQLVTDDRLGPAVVGEGLRSPVR